MSTKNLEALKAVEAKPAALLCARRRSRSLLLYIYGSLGDLKSDGKAQCSSGMRYRNVEFLVSILYYSPAVVQPRKPFVQEISRKKDRTVFQCPPYIFPYILSPYVMHVLYR